MFWPGTGVKHARNIEIITIFGNLISVFSMFRACFSAEHCSMPAVEGTHKILIFPTSCAPAKLSRCSYNMVSIF